MIQLRRTSCHSHSEPLEITLHQQADCIRLLFVGDTGYGENYHAPDGGGCREGFIEKRGRRSFVKSLQPFLDTADFVIANLETVATEERETPYRAPKKFLGWTCEESVAFLAHAGINVVSLANNHAMDFGARGLTDTIDAVSRSRMHWFGAGNDWSQAGRHLLLKPESRVPDVAVIAAFDYQYRYDWLYGFYAGAARPGVQALNLPVISSQIKHIKTVAPDTFVIVFPHWGKNYRWRTGKQRRQARCMMSSGADLIVGHGSHAIQQIENISGKWTIYGLGNFLWNAPGRYRRFNMPGFSLVALLEIDVSNSPPRSTLRLYPIMTDNLVNDYQGYAVTEEEFRVITEVLMTREPTFDPRSSRDTLGRHYVFDVTRHRETSA